MTTKITKVIHPLLQISSNITSPVLDDAPSCVAHQNPWRPSPDTPEEVAEDGGVSQLKLPWSLSVTQSWRECFCWSWWLMTLTSTFSSFPRWNAFSLFLRWNFTPLTPSIRDLLLVFPCFINIFSLVISSLFPFQTKNSENGWSPRSLEIFP